MKPRDESLINILRCGYFREWPRIKISSPRWRVYSLKPVLLTARSFLFKPNPKSSTLAKGSE